jgi:hypothetical protein
MKRTSSTRSENLNQSQVTELSEENFSGEKLVGNGNTFNQFSESWNEFSQAIEPDSGLTFKETEKISSANSFTDACPLISQKIDDLHATFPAKRFLNYKNAIIQIHTNLLRCVASLEVIQKQYENEPFSANSMASGELLGRLNHFEKAINLQKRLIENFELSRPSQDEIAPYLAFESAYPHIFQSNMIQLVELAQPTPLPQAVDVDMDKFSIINATRDGVSSIGTTQLASCVGIGMRAKNSAGDVLLGMMHNSVRWSPRQALKTLSNNMFKVGGDPSTLEVFLVGGMIASKESEGGTSLRDEKAYLDGGGEYVKAARLHLNLGEGNPETGEFHSINMLLTADQVLYGRQELYSKI